MRMHLRILAIVLIGAAFSTQASFAQDNAGSGAHDDAKASNYSATPGAENPTKFDNQSAAPDDNNNSGSNGVKLPAENNRARDGNATAFGEKGNDAIDTRMSVQLHRPGAKPNKIGEAKLKMLLVPKNAHRRTFSALGSSNRTVRNSIGAPIGQREDIERRDNKQLVSPVGSHIPATTVTSAVRAPAGSDTKIEGQIARPTPNVGRPVASLGANHAVINGTGRVRSVPNSSGIGGPSTAIDGISGTSIRPKH